MWKSEHTPERIWMVFVMLLLQKSEEMKKKGNDNFQKKQYDDAVEFYSKAIKY